MKKITTNLPMKRGKLEIRYLVFAVFVFSIFLVMINGNLYAQEQSSPDRSMAVLYLEEAHTIFREYDGTVPVEKEKNFISLIETALEFFPEHPDALYMLAAEGKNTAGSVYIRLDMLRRAAVKEEDWIYFSPYDCRIEEARLLKQIGRIEEGLLLLNSLESTRRAAYHTPDYYFLKAGLLIQDGRVFEGEIVLRRGLDFFPDNREMMIALLRISREFLEKTADMLLEERVALGAGNLLETAIIEIPEKERKLSLLELYKNNFADLPPALAAVDFLLNLGGDLKEFYSKQNVLERRTVVQLYRGYKEQNQDISDIDPLSDFTGSIRSDENYDGIFEETLEYKNGNPIRWLVDRNQDGLAEYHTLFGGDGLPRRVSGENRQRKVLFVFSDYPEVKEVTLETAKGTKKFTLFPGEFSYPYFVPTDGNDSDYPQGLLVGEINRTLSPVSEEFLKQKSLTISENYGEDDTILWQRLENNVWRKTVYLPLGGIGTTLIRGSEEVHTLIDEDADGKNETNIVYEDGEIIRKEVDANLNGIPEFVLFTEENISQWDINEDGLLDIREYQMGGDRRVREYSSRLDGVFDTRIVWNRKEISEIIREGKALPVYRDPQSADSGPALFWIGDKPFLSIDPEKLPSFGMVERNGKLLQVFTQFGSTYIEVVN